MGNELNQPAVNPGDWISVGQNVIPVSAVVCVVFENKQFGDLEVVYMDGSKAISTEVVWDNDHWKFANSGAGGGYADNSERLSIFVSILKSGQKY